MVWGIGVPNARAAGRHSRRPVHHAGVAGPQHDDAEGDPVPREHRVAVTGDKTQQRTHRQHRDHERSEETKREQRQIEKAEHVARQTIPAGFDFHAIGALRYETREKLSAIRPRDLGQAARISGVTPADIAILSVWLKKATVPDS